MLSLGGFAKSMIKSGIMPGISDLEDLVITYKQVLRDRPNDAKDRSSTKRSPAQNSLYYADYKIAIIRFMF